MSQKELSFVSFEMIGTQFRASLTMETFAKTGVDPEVLLQRSASVYEKSIHGMCHIVDEIRAIRENRQLTPARKIWELGDEIFRLTKELAALSLQVDGLYGHLVHDLGVKRKWLEKVVIFRRYLPNKRLIPKSLNWGQCEKGTRKTAERLLSGSRYKANGRGRNH